MIELKDWNGSPMNDHVQNWITELMKTVPEDDEGYILSGDTMVIVRKQRCSNVEIRVNVFVCKIDKHTMFYVKEEHE